jgi:hypothetical protein
MRFANGILCQAEPPAWFLARLESVDDPDWQGSLLKKGLLSWETFEGSETYEIYKQPDGGYFVDYMDAFESAAWIFIDKLVDYITFRATILAPLVILAAHADGLATAEIKKKAAA